MNDQQEAMVKPPQGMAITNITTDADLARNESRWRIEQVSIVHHCPPKGSGLTPCCERTPFELPLMDRMTSDASMVTCRPER